MTHMPRIYVPREFTIELPDIDLHSVSGENLYLENKNSRIDAKIRVDTIGKKVYFFPLLLHYDEFAEYRITFDKTMKFKTGKHLSDKFYLSFRIKNGKIYSSNKMYNSDNNSMENILGLNIKVYISNGGVNGGGEVTYKVNKEKISNFLAENPPVKSDSDNSKSKRYPFLLIFFLLAGLSIFFLQRYLPRNKKEDRIDFLTLSDIKKSAQLTDSDHGYGDIKELVELSGGETDGVLRFSIMWNDTEYNQNDFDAFCVEPGTDNYIYYANKSNSATTGTLDVDIVSPERNIAAVENIAWIDRDRMQEGAYVFYVNNYSHRGGTNGFKAEIEFEGEIYSFEYDEELEQGETVRVAEINFDRYVGFTVMENEPEA